ncbi:hypothetical protein C7974DRAFT_414598 [Boeremia exigua]|uniref:uncharacterized protein n=1 Tax=Boeremia exigua TaxID=749465 RepID=UPI001E8C9E69|nr:uncharacterized protein C7974DRAFT_414598 [Boeremia exigua]KAH6621916.1 hypothetical protein C7974DRAFT_414598 [Boeremia exigua]
MLDVVKQSTTRSAKPYGPGHGPIHDYAQDSARALQIIQYRSYQRDIYIYHVRRNLLPLPLIRRALQRQNEYHDRLSSFDPMRHYPVTDGDEIPAGCIEAAYLPSVFHGHGSALALRSDQASKTVEWFVFSGPFHDIFLSQIICTNGDWILQPDLHADDPRKVFDLVGYAGKGLQTRTVRGANREHKGWHDSLSSAEETKRTVKLTWKGYGNELKADQERRRREETAEGTEEERQIDAQVSGDLFVPPQPPQKPVARHKA